MVTVNDRAGSSIPCRVVDVYRSGLGATFSVADARLTYSHMFASDADFGIAGGMDSEPINVSMNYFMFEKRTDDPVYDIPIGELPLSPFNYSNLNSINCQSWDWLSDTDREDFRNASQKCNWTRDTPTTHYNAVYRTAGLVPVDGRPFVLVGLAALFGYSVV